MRSPLFCLTSLLTKLTFHAFHAFLLKTVFVLAFLVIVPLCNPAGNLWNLIEDSADAVTDALIPQDASGTPLTRENMNEKYTQTYYIPIVMLVSGVALNLQAYRRQSYR